MISVVVPIYNVEKFLMECLVSLKGQSFTDFEVLLIDDGSTDKSGQIAHDFAKKNNNFHYFRKKNGGLSSARNYGIDRSCGEWLTFVDSDDVIAPNYLQKLYDLVIRNNCLIGICNFKHFEIAIPLVGHEEIVENVYPHDMYMKEMFSSTFMAATNKIYHKSLFEEIRYPYGKIHEDFGTTYKLIDKVSKIVKTSEVLYFYRFNPDSITLSKIKNNKKNLLDIYKSQLDYFKPKQTSNLYRNLYKKIANQFFSCFGTLLSYPPEKYVNYNEFYAQVNGFYFENYEFLKSLPLSFFNRILLILSLKKVNILRTFAILKRKIK